MSDNDSKTLDGSDGSTFEIDQGDRVQTNELRIPRIKNSGHANELFAAVGHKLDNVNVANLSIPTAPEEAAAARAGDARETILGRDQRTIELSRLSDELSVLQAKAEKLQANGQTVPLQLANEITAKMNSVDFQYDRLQATTVDAVTAEGKRDQEMLLSIYETDFEVAVRRTMRQHGVNKQLGREIALQLIEATGEANVLPQYHRVNERLKRKYPASNS